MSAFTSIKVGKDTLSTHIALAPLTRLRAPNAVPSTQAIDYYRQRAAATPGTLLISEATGIAPQAIGYATAPGIWSQEQITAWKKITDAVHEEKSFIYLQLWAVGRIVDDKTVKTYGDFDVVGPSDIPMEGGVKPRALEIKEIKEYVELYRKAAKNAVEAGFDGVEIHSANGYLLDQFLHENANNRTDQYGGSIENRSRFTLEVVDAVTAEIGANRTAIRLSPWGDFQTMDAGVSPVPQFSYLIAELETRAQKSESDRLAYIHFVDPRVNFFGDFDSYGKVNRSAADFISQIWQGVIVRAGAFGKDVKELNEVVSANNKTIIAIGRLFISNPDLIKKLERNLPLSRYDRNTFYWDGKFPIEKGYTEDYAVSTKA